MLIPRLLHSPWQVWADTGGTFTDCLAIDPAGRWHRAKVLSSSSLRARVSARVDDHSLHYSAPWTLPDGFADGARLVWLERESASLESDDKKADHQTSCPRTLVSSCLGLTQHLQTADALPKDLRVGEPFELRFDDEAPILAARLLTATPVDEPLPLLSLRLATTRGTNALLERRGAKTALFITRGFADLLRIGDQQRPDLFALDIQRPAPLYEAVVEVSERTSAEGMVIEPLDLAALDRSCDELLAAGFESAAVALLHSYRRPEHEQDVARYLRQRGFASVSASAELAPMIKILPRAQTAVVNAYLSPIVERYLDRVGSAVVRGSLHAMTSAGGLVRASAFEPKDSLLSGPAGGVVGAVLSARECGDERVIAFDMGGTSTDVARFDGDYEYLFEHRVGDATVAAPALAIESVAAGGGSICWHDGAQLKVGPRSAGADPGPACYGAGGPLSLTDVNLLLGRLDPDRFGIPITPAASRRALKMLIDALRQTASYLDEEAVLTGFLEIANERMADAIRRISVRRGYDPRQYALVAFGGAGGQHACAVASLLGIRRVLMPREAGLLSAVGLGAAVIERFAHRQVLRDYEEVSSQLTDWLAALAEEATSSVLQEGVAKEDIEIRRRLVFLRFSGQETSLEISFSEEADLLRAFAERYEAVYGYRPQTRAIEVEALRVVASSRQGFVETIQNEASHQPAEPQGEQQALLGGSWRVVPTYTTRRLNAGDQLVGPALVFDDHATLIVEAGWEGRVSAKGAIVLTFRNGKVKG